MSTETKRRCHLILTTELWNVLVAEAESRELQVSVVVRERLARSFGLDTVQIQTVKRPVSPKKSQRRQCRLWVEAGLWNRLTEEANMKGTTVKGVILERLYQGLTSKREGPIHEEVLPRAPEMTGPMGTKKVSVFDLSE
jgi:hypothetical protein